MKLFNKDVDYALRILATLAKTKGKLVTSNYLSNKQEIPLRYLRKIVSTLSRKKYISVKEGRGGGIELNKDLAKVSIYQIIKIFNTDADLCDCMFKNKSCPNYKTCTLKKEITKIQKDALIKFKKITVAKIA